VKKLLPALLMSGISLLVLATRPLGEKAGQQPKPAPPFPAARTPAAAAVPAPAAVGKTWSSQLPDLRLDNVAGVVAQFAAEGLFEGEHYHEFYALMDAWCRIDTYAALDFALRQVGTDTAHAVTTSILQELDPAETIGYLLRQPAPVQWEAAANWMAYLDAQNRASGDGPQDEPCRLSTFGGIVRLWSELDPAAVAAWLPQQEPGMSPVAF
jgi:hypothetical protein